ncbi:hypothetical protein GQ53DRAFT_233752 [Thozetella sp. PMI_491]|nr:hypothetical protein GQ53DRAFT_233752 [Thozetella sp. PMI_491]
MCVSGRFLLIYRNCGEQSELKTCMLGVLVRGDHYAGRLVAGSRVRLVSWVRRVRAGPKRQSCRRTRRCNHGRSRDLQRLIASRAMHVLQARHSLGPSDCGECSGLCGPSPNKKLQDPAPRHSPLRTSRESCRSEAGDVAVETRAAGNRPGRPPRSRSVWYCYGLLWVQDTAKAREASPGLNHGHKAAAPQEEATWRAVETAGSASWTHKLP